MPHQVAHLFGVLLPAVCAGTLVEILDLFSMRREVLPALRGNGVDLAVVLFLHAGVAQLFEKLQRRIDYAGAWPVCPSAALTDRLHDFVAMSRLLFDGIENQIADLAPLCSVRRSSEHLRPVHSATSPPAEWTSSHEEALFPDSMSSVHFSLLRRVLQRLQH